MKQRISETTEAEVLWVVKERRSGLWIVQHTMYNKITNFGLTAFASAPSGSYIAPIYLVIDNANTTMANTYLAGVSSVQTVGDPTVAGDTQLDLSVGLASQETVTFSSKSGTGPFTWTLSANTVNSHSSGDPVVRTPTAADTVASVLGESQYDPVYFVNSREPITSAFSPATGQNTSQYFIAGIQATNLFFAHVGLADSLTIGTGNLHNYASLGYNHNNTNDVEIDVTYVVTTS
jgi:hypothetical protein